MKDPANKTKVVLRHLPPSISESAVRDQIDGRFSGRYGWFSFCPGKDSQKNKRYSRAYIDFQRPEDVIEFAEFFDGHVFVNEKGAQLKALVEYAPSQRVPKILSKKDGREGSIFKDPDYVEFLELISKPAENLPSAEIQLERREAEKSGGSKDKLIVTPLMDFIRQKRAAKSVSQRPFVNGKIGRRAGVLASSSSSPSSKRGSEKRRGSTSMYVLRDNTKSSSGKDKSAYMLVSRKDNQKLPSARAEDESVNSSSGTKSIVPGIIETGKGRVMLLKGKEREIIHVSDSSSQQQTVTSTRNFVGSSPSKQNQRHEASGKIIRSILSNKDARQNQSSPSSASDHQIVNSERDKRPPRPNPRQILKDNITIITRAPVSDKDGERSVDEKAFASDLHGPVFMSEKNERRTRNKDRPDRGVWTTYRRSDNDDNTTQLLSEGRANVSTVENGSHKHVARRSGFAMKEVDGSMNFMEGKTSKRTVGYGPHEKQVWVQKSGSAS